MTDITKLTVEQLKALAYDSLALIEQNQNNLRLINQEILNKSKDEPSQPKS